MIEFLQAVLAFIVALGILITFHEFGHFWVARKCNVKILRFSVGFGRPIWKRRFGDDNSEFVIAALPLGGYVKMLDEREGNVAAAEQHRAFNSKPLAQRFAIVIAGPVFNFIFAIFAYWIMFVVGVPGIKPVVGEVSQGSLAEYAGIRTGDQIIKVDERQTPTWSSVIDVFVANIIEEEQVKFTIRDTNGFERESYVDLAQVSVDEMASGRLLSVLGLQPLRPVIPAVIGKVIQDGAAERAKLLPGDKIIAAEGKSIADWIAWVELIRESPGKPLTIEVVRGENYFTVNLIPDSVVTEEGDTIGRIGAVVDDAYQRDESMLATESYAFIPAFFKAINKTAEMSMMTLRILGKMIVGEASVKNLSGPISIAQYAGYSAGLGIAAFLSFLAIVSVSLGVLNLLPIPLLDGGHLMYYLVEFVKGSPVSEGAQILGQQIGLTVLLGLMGLAFYNDILRLVG